VKHYNIQRGSHVSLSLFSCESPIEVAWEFGNLGFLGGRKTGEPEEKALK